MTGLCVSVVAMTLGGSTPALAVRQADPQSDSVAADKGVADGSDVARTLARVDAAIEGARTDVDAPPVPAAVTASEEQAATALDAPPGASSVAAALEVAGVAPSEDGSLAAAAATSPQIAEAVRLLEQLLVAGRAVLNSDEVGQIRALIVLLQGLDRQLSTCLVRAAIDALIGSGLTELTKETIRRLGFGRAVFGPLLRRILTFETIIRNAIAAARCALVPPAPDRLRFIGPQCPERGLVIEFRDNALNEEGFRVRDAISGRTQDFGFSPGTGLFVQRVVTIFSDLGDFARPHRLTVVALGSIVFGIPGLPGSSESDPSNEIEVPGQQCPSTSAGTIFGRVTNAVNGQAVAGATIRVRLGQGEPPCSNSNVIVTTTANSNGEYETLVPDGIYDVQASASGFTTDCADNVQVFPVQRRGQNFSLSPALAPGAMRIVLTWGANPSDLDSHLWTPSDVPYHLYYRRLGSTTACPNARLDVDDQDGFGPETITIAQRFQIGQYRYAVNRFDGSGTLGGSGAFVRVFNSTGLIASFNVPSGTGDWWYVFDIDGLTGSVRPVNQLRTSEPAPYPDTSLGCGSAAAAAVVGETGKSPQVSASGSLTPALPAVGATSVPSVAATTGPASETSTAEESLPAAAASEVGGAVRESSREDRLAARVVELEQRAAERERSATSSPSLGATADPASQPSTPGESVPVVAASETSAEGIPGEIGGAVRESREDRLAARAART